MRTKFPFESFTFNGNFYFCTPPAKKRPGEPGLRLQLTHYFYRIVMDFITDYHLQGLVIGVCTFLIIGLFHPVVIKAEYYWGTRCWWIFLLLGLAGIAVSMYVESITLSALAGVFGFSSFWTIKELFDQEKRVQKGWFPKNPKRTYKF